MRSRVPGDRDSRGAWISDSRVPVAAEQPPTGRLRRIVREPHAPAARDRRSDPCVMAGARAAVRAHLGDRLGGRRLGYPAVDRARPRIEGHRSRSYRLLVGGQRAAREDSASAPDIKHRSRRHSPRCAHHDRCRGHDHVAGSSRADRRRRGRRTPFCSRASCSAIPIGRCGQRASSASRFRGRSSISGLRQTAHGPVSPRTSNV